MNIFNRRNKSERETLGGRLFLALFGILAVLGSIVMLWLNEGRVNFGKVAEDSVYASGASFNGDIEDTFVALEGNLTSSETVEDPQFLAPSSYIKLNRSVEMYAWSETESTDEDTDETYYDYSSDWTSSPENSSHFQYSDYENPELPFFDAQFTVNTAQVGIYAIDPGSVEYPELSLLNPEDVTYNDLANSQFDYYLEGEYLYIGYGTLSNPEIGDIRVQFSAIEQDQQVTIFGDVSGERIIPHPTKNDDQLYRIFFIGRESAIAQMHGEYTTALWGFRIGGFLMMWCGIFLVISPITFLISFIPALEKAGNFLIGAITLPIAAILSFLIIIVSFIAHRPIILISLLVLIGGGIGALIYFSRKNTQENKIA